MKTIVLVALALIFVALPAFAGSDAPGNTFTMSGTLAKVDCTVTPTFGGTPLLQCALAVRPDPGFTDTTTVYCLDPGVAQACNSYQAGDPVIVVGREIKNNKVVDKIAYWTKTAF